ncbi:MAG: type I-E CRISPR-associated protein Cse2/CasB [Deltaproteobacteria bacterium]|nr:type I-E CRISPR-associated protein Cse2/CasB [Deltaproteobacteria bacterium]
MSKTPHQDRLVDHLESIAREDDRATLAALRASLREGREVEALRIVLPYIGANRGVRAEDNAVLLAGLFALHPESSSLSLATVLRFAAMESESVELRFRALLAAHRDELATHLRHAITLASARGFGIDWRDLHRALTFWNHEDDFVRREWARDFWAPPESPSPKPNTETTPNTP